MAEKGLFVHIIPSFLFFHDCLPFDSPFFMRSFAHCQFMSSRSFAYFFAIFLQEKVFTVSFFFLSQKNLIHSFRAPFFWNCAAFPCISVIWCFVLDSAFQKTFSSFYLQRIYWKRAIYFMLGLLTKTACQKGFFELVMLTSV